MLAAYPILRTRSTDAVVALIEGATGNSLLAVGRDAPDETEINGLWFRSLSFASVRYGFAATLAGEDEASTYILSLPVRGTMCLARGDRRHAIGPGMGVILSPGVPQTLDYAEQLERIVVRIAADALARHFALLTGKPAAPLRFDGVLAAGQAAFVALQRQVLVTMSRIEAGLLGPEDAAEEVESSILSTIILSLPHDRWAELNAPSPAPSPGSVRRVVDFVHANAHQPITLEDLVTVSGVAGRTLFKHFHAFKGMGPMAYLRRVRMDRVREALAAAGPGDTVTAIALRWNFHELGRFAGAYRRVYGETPSATLRRRQRSG